MRTPLKLTALLLAVAILAPGCGGAREAKTPKDAAINMAKAFETGDKDLFLSSIKVADKETVSKMFDGMTAMKQFAEKFEKAYGRPLKGVNLGDIPSADEIEKKLEVKIDGDKATGTMEGQTKPMPFVKEGGKWLVDLGKDMPTGQEKEGVVKMFEATKKAVDELMPKIGAEGYDADKMEKEFGTAMMKAMGMPTPAMPSMPPVPTPGG
jgi:ABC-type glycerol-3-phosphate transport system substrate-binding protein